MWQSQGLLFPHNGVEARDLPLHNIDNASIVDNNCDAVGQAKEICANNGVLGEASRENVRTSTKSPLSNTENNRDLVQALPWGITLYKFNNRLPSNSLRDNLLSDGHSRDKFAAFFSTQTSLIRKSHLLPTQSQNQHSAHSKSGIFTSQNSSGLENPHQHHPNSHKLVAQQYNSSLPTSQNTIFHPGREIDLHSSHISEHALSLKNSSPQERQGNSDNSHLNETKHFLTAEARSPSERASCRSINDHQPDFWENPRSNPTRKSSLRSLLSVNSSTSEVRVRNSGFLGRHRCPSTPEIHFPRWSSSFSVQSKFRSASLCSLNRVPCRRKENLFIDVKNRRIFLKPTSTNSPITPVNTRPRILRQGKKIPVLTPLWVIHPQHNKDASSTGAMASSSTSYSGALVNFDGSSRGSGRIISVSDDITYYSPTALPEGRSENSGRNSGGNIGEGNGRNHGAIYGPNLDDDLDSLSSARVDRVYIGRRAMRRLRNQLQRARDNVPEEQSAFDSFLEKLRKRLASFCCFNSD